MDEAATRVLDAAECLFYERGIHAVGMDELRSASGVSLKRLYQCFPAKEQVVVAYLRRRHSRWLGEMRAFVEGHEPGSRVAAVFDWLDGWFREPGFRGCAFVNSAGEMGAGSPVVLAVAREHKVAVRGFFGELTGDETLATQLSLLAEGAITLAAVGGDPSAACQAKDAAAVLVDQMLSSSRFRSKSGHR
ncbi:TetR/AcrR family transcriptional regulator [Actinokineospora auranticolor]|uniref:AcrR family transcriptional regulator n=1 Tax=Actinokineospora auranticolor TaxID=155976 RepID=A0A2S6GDJ8_9PSEU|nr:TetR/AcrR family transcriptional regulator [Actinokineospora auranticolor]PPK63280.1 AcrR family transcriptional regulator [Actinokineospora auranticolor]